jgi:hypothetical protein
MERAMMNWRLWVRAGLMAAVGFGVVSPRLALAIEPPAKDAAKIDQPDARFIRTVDDEEAGTIVMQSAARTFVREKDGKQVGPAITMCAAVHIADKAFYERLQALLDAKDVVLFESVKPAGTGRPEYDLPGAGADQRRVHATKLRIRMLGIAARAQKLRTGAYPASVDDLLAGLSAKLRPYIEGVSKDAWGRALVYERTVEPGAPGEAAEGRGGKADGGSAPVKSTRPKIVRDTIEITSLGADGKAGGEGVNEDLHLSDQHPIRASEVPRADTKGLQSELAEAFGLVFQLDAMTHEHKNWRNSDLSVDQVEERLAGGLDNVDDDGNGGGGESEALFKLLDGSSFSAGLIKLVLGAVKWIPGAQLYGKVSLMEMLGRADDLLKTVPQMEKMLDVIIKDRNAVVIGDVTRIIETEPNVKTIGIIYGGGHMPDLERQLEAMGYKEQSVRWLDAITVDEPKDAAGKQQLESIRDMVRRSLDEQVEMARRKKEKDKGEE